MNTYTITQEQLEALVALGSRGIERREEASKMPMSPRVDESALGLGSTKMSPFEIGETYFIRTVTYHLTGRVRKIVGNFLVLEDAAWIAESGRFQEAIKTGLLSEVEPVGDAFVNMDSITDAFPWKTALPREQK